MEAEPRVLVIEDNCLYRKVQGQHLFARKVQYHPSFRKTFNLRYIGHIPDAKLMTSVPKVVKLTASKVKVSL